MSWFGYLYLVLGVIGACIQVSKIGSYERVTGATVIGQILTQCAIWAGVFWVGVYR